jgi:HD-GYP domain-containing protein (c-di-GMP phosphodiesterase class II)
MEARILGVADAYEAMTSGRPYSAAMTAGDAAAELRRGAGTQFDSRIVDAFLESLPRAEWQPAGVGQAG